MQILRQPVVVVYKKSGAESGTVMAQKAAQQASVEFGMELQEKTKALVGKGLVPIHANPCDTVHSISMTPTGFEPVLPA